MAKRTKVYYIKKIRQNAFKTYKKHRRVRAQNMKLLRRLHPHKVGFKFPTLRQIVDGSNWVVDKIIEMA